MQGLYSTHTFSFDHSCTHLDVVLKNLHFSGPDDGDLGEEDENLEIEVPISPSGKPNCNNHQKKHPLIGHGSNENLSSPIHSTQILLNNRNNCVKSPVQLNSELIVKKLCDKKQPNNSVNLPPPPASLRSPRRSTSAALDYQNSVCYFI